MKTFIEDDNQNKKEALHVPVNPDQYELLKYLYGELEEKEFQEFKMKISENEDLQSLERGLLATKARYKFKSVEEHLAYVNNCYTKFREEFDDFL